MDYLSMLEEAADEREAKKNILSYEQYQNELLKIGAEAAQESRRRKYGRKIQFRGDMGSGDIRISPELTVIWEKIKRIKGAAECRERVMQFLDAPEQEGGCRVISAQQLRKGIEEISVEEGEEQYRQIWFATTSEGIDIRPGLLDKEEPVALELGDDCVHALMAGRTGAGKSVALHAIITGLMFEYAPWELNINLADFKIVEMSKYGNTQYRAPHVEKIAATDGMEYVLSMMYDMYERMDIRQKVFAALGIQKLSQYRKMFDVVLPREILIVDEFQQMYELATPKQAEIINQLLKMITKLGRATGYHLFFTSQSMTGTVRADVLANFKLRLCLPANEEVSSMVLGNKAASELTGLKSRGYLIANGEGGARDFNQEFWVPLVKEGKKEGEEGDLEKALRVNARLAEKLGYDKGMDFYREEALRPLFGEKDSMEADLRLFFENTETAVAGEKELEGYLLLGDSCVYARLPGKNSSLEYTPLRFGDRKNVLCIGDSVSQRAYMLELLMVQYSLWGDRNTNYVVHGDLAVKELLKAQNIGMEEIGAKDLTDVLLDCYANRELLQRFAQMPGDKQSMEVLFSYVEEQNETARDLRKGISDLERKLSKLEKELSEEEERKQIILRIKDEEEYLQEMKEAIWQMYQKGLDENGRFGFKRLRTVTFWINGSHMLSDLMEEWGGKYRGCQMADILKRCTNVGIRIILVGAKTVDIPTAVLKDFGYYLIQSNDEANFAKLGMQRPKEYKDTVLQFRAVNEPLNRQKPSLYILPQDQKLVKIFETEGAETAGREREFFKGIS